MAAKIPYSQHIYIWVNYKDLTVLPNPGIMVNLWESIPFYGLTIQIGDFFYFPIYIYIYTYYIYIYVYIRYTYYIYVYIHDFCILIYFNAHLDYEDFPLP